MRAEHLREWLRDHRTREAVAETEDEGGILELGGRERGTDDRREGGE